MTPTDALIGLAALVVAAAVIGVVLRTRKARVREIAAADSLSPADLGATAWGESGTVVQFSTVHCARCPGAGRLIRDLLEQRPRVEFVEVDLTDDPDLARTFRVVQTPTVLLLDSAGRPRTRLSGTLTRATITEALDALEPTSTVAVDPASNVARHTPDPADRGSAQLHAESRS